MVLLLVLLKKCYVHLYFYITLSFNYSCFTGPHSENVHVYFDSATLFNNFVDYKIITDVFIVSFLPRIDGSIKSSISSFVYISRIKSSKILVCLTLIFCSFQSYFTRFVIFYVVHTRIKFFIFLQLDSDEPDAVDKEDDEPDFYAQSLLPG